MGIDVGLLASTLLTSYLVPYLQQGVEGVAQKVTDAVGSAAADQVRGVMQTVWDKVSGLFDKSGDSGALEQLKKRPDQAAPLVQSVLEEKLAGEPALAKELHELTSNEGPSGQSATAYIGQAGVAVIGTVNLQHANLSSAQHLKFVGAQAVLGSVPDIAELTPNNKKRPPAE